jgi:hypothetical protein
VCKIGLLVVSYSQDLEAHFLPVAQLTEKLNRLIFVSVLLSTVLGLALLRTAPQTTANRIFKVGFAGFGTLAALITLYGLVKIYQASQAIRTSVDTTSPHR